MTTILKTVQIPADHKLHLDLDIPVECPVGEAEITVVVSPTRHPDKAKAIEYLRELSRGGGIRAIPDPIAWQNEIRQDRELPR